MADEPIVEFYIQNYRRSDGTINSSEHRFQTIPLTTKPAITEPKVKNEIGKSGSFEFGVEMTSSYYNAFIQMRTLLRVTYFGHTIFRGRVLTIDKSMTRSRKIHCEGDFSFLLDSHQPATKEENRSTITAYQYLQQIIDQHNSDMSGNSYKQFALGEVPGHYTNATPSECRVKIPSEKNKQKYGDSSWNTSMDRVESLLSDFGGYFRTRYDDSNPNSPVVYLDWFDNFYNSTVNTQTIEVTKNLIDLSGPTEVENLFTIVIPIGKKNSNPVYIDTYWPIAKPGHAKVNYITVPELVTASLYTDAQLNSGYHKKSDYENAITDYGKIWKPVNFDNANTPEKLFNYAKDWIKNNYMPEVTQWSVSALDMKFVDSTNQVILCGDRINLIHPEVDRTYEGLTVISAEYNLYNPDKNTYVIGIPNQEINAAYGVQAKKKKKGKVGGGSSKKPESDDSSVKLDIDSLKQNAQTQYSLKMDWKQDIGFDDPYAFLMYDNLGRELSEGAAAGKAMQFQKALNQLYSNPDLMRELKRVAKERGVPEDDPQLLIDFAPGMANQQSIWRSTTKLYFMDTLGLPEEEAELLVYDSSSKSELASLVTSDGEWSAKAITRGYPNLPNANEIKEQAIRIRNILDGNSKVAGSTILNSMQSWLVGGDINIGDYIKSNLGIDTKDFNIGDLFNINESTNEITGLLDKGVNFLDGLFEGDLSGLGLKEFNLESVSAVINGLLDGGNAGFGTNGQLNNGFKVTINKPFTYTATDPDGQQHLYTVSAGEVAASDFHFTAKYDSLYAKLLVADNLIADKATIDQLNAATARISTIESDYIKTGNIQSVLGDFTLLNVQSIATSKSDGTSHFSSYYGNNYYFNIPGGGGSVSYRNIKDGVFDVTLSKSGNTYTLNKKNYAGTETEIGTFSRAITGWSETSSSGKLIISASPQNQKVEVPISISGDAIISSNGPYTYLGTFTNTNTGRVMSIDGCIKTVTVAVPTYSHSMTITKCPTSVTTSGASYYGKLYYYNSVANTYIAYVSANKYWYYSDTDHGGTVHY